LSAWLVECLLQFLEWCAALPGALWQQHVPPPWAIALALVGVAWALAPRGTPSRLCALALLAPAFLFPPPSPREGEAWITTLDVGQGLAVLVRTQHRTLVYDAGPAFGPEADSGGRIILPALRAAGVERIDLLVLTHEDLDHIGGAVTILESLPVDRLASSLAPEHPVHALAPQWSPCTAGSAWEWDDVRFRFLSPDPAMRIARRNDSSCVLRVETAGGAMLLTGDIEKPAEAYLLGAPAVLKSDVLLVPHHGSRTSSTSEFISAVAPRWAVVPVGYLNRFGHPNADVLARYRSAGIELLRTDRQGAVHVILGAEGATVATERALRPRYWRAPGSG
ncbi:MAG: DNA internalization-related competence protein ComEC/Rec2, partial [Betaproteobacteria bacterium]|nr:DNA internalization-related competence protein ComEC/Rec2 [Betaproteobacteria bacterium]